MYNKKAGKSGPVAPKCKRAENLHRIDRHLPKISLNPKFLGYSKSPESSEGARPEDVVACCVRVATHLDTARIWMKHGFGCSKYLGWSVTVP